MVKFTREVMQKIEETHEAVTLMKPTFERLKEMGKPDGVFDKIGKAVTEHDIKIKNNNKKINWLYGIIGGLIVGILLWVFTGG